MKNNLCPLTFANSNSSINKSIDSNKVETSIEIRRLKSMNVNQRKSKVSQDVKIAKFD